MDKYLDGIRQGPGREVVERRHLNTNAGDMVVQRIRERITFPDGTMQDTMQHQFFVVRFNLLHILSIEVPAAVQASYAKDTDVIGTSFTPVR